MSTKIKRLLATYIDFAIIFCLCYYTLSFLQSFIVENIFVELIISLLFIVSSVYVFLRKDIIFGYESIGKKIVRLKIYDNNDERVTDKKILIDRVFLSLSTFHLYIFMILINNKSNGDEKIGTIVK